VALLAEEPIVLTVRNDLPVKDFAEFVACAQKNQNKMQFGSAGAGSATLLGCVLLNLRHQNQHQSYRARGRQAPGMRCIAALT
jgi:tripartite-type tricarboxylate transporter receptor subunit TctC